MRICVSLTENTTGGLIEQMTALSEQVDLFEVRGDLVEDLDLRAILTARRKPLLFTCLPCSEGGRWPDEDPRRRAILLQAVERGFDYVDVSFLSGLSDVIVAKAGRGLVVSYHDLKTIPDDLDGLYRRMAATGADIVKIAAMPRTLADVGRLMAYASHVAGADGTPFLSIAMGSLGAPTRILGGRDNAPFTFAAARSGAEAAPGQIPLTHMTDLYRVRDLSRKTRVYGILGQGVHVNPSLAMLNRGFAALGMDAVCVPIEADALSSFLEALPGLRLVGFGVTRPFTSEIVGHLSEIDPLAEKLGNVDTVNVVNERLLGLLTSPESAAVAVEGALDETPLSRAAAQFEIWTGRAAPIDVMRGARYAAAVADRPLDSMTAGGKRGGP